MLIIYSKDIKPLENVVENTEI